MNEFQIHQHDDIFLLTFDVAFFTKTPCSKSWIKRLFCRRVDNHNLRLTLYNIKLKTSSFYFHFEEKEV